MWKKIASYLEDSLNFIVPHACHVCGFITKDSYICKRCLPSEWLERPRCFHCYCDLDFSGVCNHCAHTLAPFWRMRYLWHYEHLARDFIISMKNSPSRVLCKLAATSLVKHLDHLFIDQAWDIVVPIPPAKQSITRRGFVPTDLLAHSIVKKLSLSSQRCKLSFCLSHRGYNIAPQASLKTSQRVRNVRDTFICTKLNGENVLLVDDVLTTGATTIFACLELLEAGATRVDIVLLARAARWHPQSISGILRRYDQTTS